MSTQNLQALGERLVRMRLIEQTQLDQAMLSLSGASAKADELLNVLESRSILTTYQVSRIRKEDWNELVLGDYKLMYQNASGSFARVYRAASLHDGTMVGMKVLRQRWASEKKHIDDFHREAELGMTLQQENIVPIYAHGTQDGTHFLVMEFVEGGNLKDFIQIRKKLSPAEAMQYALDMAKGLEYALKMGFTHRDLKLTNVLMSSRGVAKLVDFGLAGSDDEAHHQRAVEYATIEKSTGAPQNDPRSDLFFLGVILYELLSGQSAYPRTNDLDERKQVARYRNIRPIQQIEPNIPPPVREVIDRLLSYRPENRFQSATELIRELGQVLAQLEEHDAEPQESVAGTSFAPGGESTVANHSSTNSKQTSLPSILCVEHRTKQQNVLREYLSRRGFRPLMISDVDRALNRLQNNPPDCVVFFGESVEDELFRGFDEAALAASRTPLAVVAVLSKEQNADREKLNKTSTHRVLLSPITLRDLRKEVHLAMQRLTMDSTELNSVNP